MRHILSQSLCRCRANMAHIRQSRPDSGLLFQVQGLKGFRGVPFSRGGDLTNLASPGFSRRILKYTRSFTTPGRSQIRASSLLVRPQQRPTNPESITRPKDDWCVPHTRNVNLRTVSRPYALCNLDPKPVTHAP